MLEPITPLPSRLAPRPRLAPRLEAVRAPAGLIHVPAAADHRLRIHTGAPARGSCGRQRFVLTRGDLDLVPAGMTEEWSGEDEADVLVITLPHALVQRAAAELGQGQSALGARCQFRDPRIEHIAWALDAERSAGSPGGLLYAESLGIALAAHLLGAYASPAEPARPSRAFSAAERARITEYIEEHLDQRLGLDTLADVLGLSTSHFKALFRRSLGLPVHEYVIQRRVERARALLLEGKLPAGEIALASGFAHQSHMARCMRRVLGVTPKGLVRAQA